MSQASLWQNPQYSAQFAELCNALYERELRLLATSDIPSVTSIKGKLKGLTYYINRTAHLMINTQSPLELDVQNASWSTKQMKKTPLAGQSPEVIWQWYQSFSLTPGLVVPLLIDGRIVVDSIDRIDMDKKRFRTNANGWFNQERIVSSNESITLLKPNKKVMAAACSGHRWNETGPLRPEIPTLRELLLTCSINWQSFKVPIIYS